MRSVLLALGLLLGGCGFDHEGAVEYLGDNREQIAAAGRTFSALVPEGYGVKIEFRGRNTIDFHVSPPNSDVRGRRARSTDVPRGAVRDTSGRAGKAKPLQPTPVAVVESVEVWDARLTDPEVQRGLHLLGWTETDVARVRELVESVDGIGISGPMDRGGIVLRYRRHFMGMYEFMVSDRPMVEEDRVGYSGCSAYYLDTQTALVYGGAAFGSGCMPPPGAW